MVAKKLIKDFQQRTGLRQCLTILTLIDRHFCRLQSLAVIGQEHSSLTRSLRLSVIFYEQEVAYIDSSQHLAHCQETGMHPLYIG